MVAVVGGNGLGLFNASLNTLGGAGVIGQGRQGLFGGSAYVNAANGNLVLQALDEQLSGRGLDLAHLRTYNAQGVLTGTGADGDGDGWRWDGERRVVVTGTNGAVGSKVTRTGGDGHVTEYLWDIATSRYVGTEGSGAHDSFVYDATKNQWVWTDGTARLEERYTASTGRLASQTDAAGNKIDFLFNTGGRLSEVIDAGSSQRLILTYATVTGTTLTRLSRVETRALNVDASGRATNVLGAALKQVDYGYDSLGRLTSVKTDLTPSDVSDDRYYGTGYTYEANSFRIASILQSDGTAAGTAYANFTYEQVGTTSVYRVKTVTDASGTQSFDYSVANQTTVTDASGQVWRYVYDAQQRLTQIQMPPATAGGAASTTSFTYDTAGNVLTVTDAQGKTTTYAYDAQGNRTLERDALGNTVTRTYNAQNQILTETRYRTPDPDGSGALLPGDPLTVRYVYDAKSRLRFVISAEGRVSEQRYLDSGTGTTYGQLERSLQYINNRYDVSALAVDAGLDESQLTAWLSSLSAADRSQAQMSQYSYDFRGNLTRRTDFANLSATTGEGVLDAAATVTEYIYDGHGQLLQTIAVRGSARDQRTTLTSATYDGMGRELTVVNASGTRTTVYDDANRTITLTNAATGLSIQQAFDARGRLLSVVQSASGASRATQYVYDSAGRLRMQVDAGANLSDTSDDLRTYNFYDSAGRLQYVVGRDGAVTGMVYDANGRLVRQTQYLSRANTSGWYDETTGVVVKTALTVGGAGSDVVVDAANDRTTTFAYDDVGRLIRQTDAANTTTTTVYDGTSRIVRTETGDRVTKFFYDRDGRQVGVLDALGYLTETKYDAAGRVVETIRYKLPSPQQANSGAPVWLGVNNRAIEGGKPFEHRLPAAFDPDGDAITYSVVGTVPASLPWLSFDAASLTLRGTPPTALATYSVTLRASDNRGTPPKTTDVTLQLSVANSAPTWAQIPDRSVAVNATGFSVVLPAASDTHSSAAQLIYSIDPTLLPPGMSFNATTRTLSGTPTTAGSYTLTARVSDAQGAFTERTFVVTVTNTGPSWGAVPVQTGRVNTAYSFVVPAAVDPEGQTLSYEAVLLPAGLSFNATTRTLSGTPTMPGAYTVVLKAKDPAGEEVQVSFTLTVSNSAPGGNGWNDPTRSLGSQQSGVPYTFNPAPPVDPEGQALTFTLVGTLPAGLSFNAATGGVSGTPTAKGDYTWRVRVSDPHGAAIEQTFYVNLRNAPPVYNGSGDWQPLNSLLGGVAFDEPMPAGLFTDINGDGLTYSLSPHPAWLSFNPTTGRLWGTPPNPQTTYVTTLTLTATDGTASVSTTLSVFIEPTGGGGTSPFLVPQGTIDTKSQTSGSTTQTAAFEALAALPPIVDPLAGLRPTDTTGLRSYLYYDGQGRMTGAVDERGFLSETIYDAHGNRQQSVRYLTALTVDAATDTLASLKQRAGAAHTTTTQFDGFGRVSTVIGVDGSVSRNIYDSAGRLARRIAAEGTLEERSSRMRYNAFGELTGTLGGVGDATLGAAPTQAQIDAAIAGYGTRYEYDSFGRQIKAIDANGKATWFYYDRENRLTHTVNAEGEVSRTVYTRFGQVESTRHYATRLTATQLAGLTGGFAGEAANDPFTSLLTVDEVNDAVTRYEYDRRGALKMQIDAEGYVTTNTYTLYGQLQTQTRTIASGRTTVSQFGYSLRGELLAQTADVGGINFNTRLEYDAYGRVVRSTDGAGNSVSTAYQDNGRTIVITDALNRAVRSEYDAYGRVWKQTDALGQVTSYSYDDSTRSTTMTTPEGVSVTTRRTRHGETLEVVDGRGNRTSYAYDRNGQLRTVTDALNRVVSETTYDNSGRVFETKDARGTVVRLAYDGVNRVLSRTVDPSGLNLQTTYSYDALGRQKRVTEGAGSATPRVTEFNYDRNSRLTQTIVDPDGLKLSTKYSFDGFGNTLKIEQGTVANPAQQVTRHEFDNLGRRVKSIAELREPLANGTVALRELTTQYRYDAAGRLSRTIDALGNSTWFVYDAAGQQIQTINALGEVSETRYDVNGRVAQTRRYFNRVAVATLAGYSDVVGPAPVTVNAADQRTALVYDKDGRQRFVLQAVAGGNWTIAESRYDANGNVIDALRYDKYLTEARVTAIESGGMTVAEMLDELTRPTTPPPTTPPTPPGLGYDFTNEATLAKTQRTRYAYDANNRLRFAVDALGGVSETVYDAAGNAIAQMRYATRPTLTGYTESAIDTAVNRGDDQNQVVRMAYDAAGRLRYSVQVLASTSGVATQHRVSRQEYDALGRVVRSTSYATTVGALANYTAATLDGAVVGSAQDRQSATVYDSAGRQVYSLQVSAMSANGVATAHLVMRSIYDDLGRVVKTTAYATGIGALANYTEATVSGAVTTNAQDRSTEIVYDSVGRQRFAIAADGGLSETVYDALGRVRETRRFALTVDKSIVWTEATLANRRAGRIVGDGTTRGQRFDYDNVGRVTGTTDALGKTESWIYNALGDKTQYTNQNGATWTYAYDRLGRQIRHTAPAVLMQLSGQTAPSAQALVTFTEYTVFGNVAKVIEAYQTSEARTTSYEYDRLGRQIKTTAPGFYDPATGRVEATNAAGRFQRTSEVIYDALGNAVRSKVRIGAGANDFLNSYKTYDVLGRTAHEVDALGNVTAYGYTVFGEQRTLSRHVVAMGATVPARGYWNAGEVATAVAGDALVRTVTTSYDNLGRRTQVTGPQAGNVYDGSTVAGTNPASIVPVSASAITEYSYTTFGEVHRERVKLDANRWSETWHYYDAMGRETRSIDAMGHHTAREFDAVGNVKEMVEYATDGVGGTLGQYAPPALPAQHADDRITAFEYDARNQQTRIQRKGLRYTQWDGTRYLQINNSREVATTVQTLTYDGVGKVTTQTDALGNTTTTSYNALGQVIKVTEPVRSVAALPNGVNSDPFRDATSVSPETHFLYGAFGRVIEQVRTPNGQLSNPDAVRTKLQYDVAGNVIVSIDARGNSTEMRYDHGGRLIRETRAVNSVLWNWETVTQTLDKRYAYDALGRRIAILDVYKDAGVDKQSGTRSVYNAFGEVEEELRVWGDLSTALGSLSRAKLATYDYNHAGQLIQKQAGDGKTVYFYNLAGQVTREEQRGNGSDADGTRTRVTETGYDLLGRALIRRQPAFTAVLDAFGNTAEAITPILEQRFDRWGNVIERTQGGYVRNADGQPRSEQRVTTRYAYNADDKVITEELPVTTAWRENGTSYQARVSHELRYDLMGRVVQELDVADDIATLPAERTELRLRTREYDSAGQLIAENDATDIADGTDTRAIDASLKRRGIRTEYAYDYFGNRIGTRNAEGTVIVDGYDKAGNLTSRSILRRFENSTIVAYDSRNPTHTPSARTLATFEYDQANRRIATWQYEAGYPLSRAEYVRYDERNQVVKTRTAGGNVTTYGYDAHGNRTRLQVGTDGAQTWSYRSGDYTVGQLQGSTLSDGRTTGYFFNDFGQLDYEAYTGQSGTRTYAYHDNGLLKRTVDTYAMGTRGAVGGADYLSAVETSEYDYTVLGQRRNERFVRTGEHDVMVFDTGVRRWVVEPQPLPALSRTTRIVYDALGRMGEVRTENPDGAAKLESLVYRYDELGNRRRIQATFVRANGATPEGSDKWYAYDREGRMAVVDGALAGNAIVAGQNGTKIGYDNVGRRASAEKSTGRKQSTDVDSGWTHYWSESHEEHYAYDDLGHLIRVEQRANRRNVTASRANQRPVDQADQEGQWYDYSIRKVEDSGNVTELRQYAKVASLSFDQDFMPTLRSIAATGYDADGRVLGQSTTIYKSDGTIDLAQSSYNTGHVYDDAGKLRTYVYHQGSGTDDYYANTYSYTYLPEFGGDREQQVTVVSTKADTRSSATVNRYDSRGRLVYQRVDVANGYDRKLFAYDSDGHVLNKQELNYRDVDDTTTTTTGRQDYFYANGQDVGMVGSGTLANTSRFGSGYTPISGAYPASTPGNYVVQRGDTLGGIAQTLFGDSALWYLIADANSLGYGPADALPTTEEGRTYRIPNAVTNLRNNANTFRPYNPAEIIGDNTPTPRIVPCTNDSTLKLANALATAISIIAERVSNAVMIAYGVPAPVAGAISGAIGGATDSALHQGIAIAAGRQDDFDWSELGKSTARGAIVGLASAGISSAVGKASETAAGWDKFNQAFQKGLASTVMNTSVRMAAETMAGRAPTFDWKQFAASAASSLAGPYMSKTTSSWQSGAVTNGISGTTSLLMQAVAGEKPDFAGAASGFLTNYLSGAIGDGIGNALGDAIIASRQAPEAKLQSQTKVVLGDARYGAVDGSDPDVISHTLDINPYLSEAQVYVSEGEFIDNTHTGARREGLADLVALDPEVQAAILAAQSEGLMPEVVIMNNVDTPAQKLYESRNSRDGVMSYGAFVRSMKDNPWVDAKNKQEMNQEFIKYRLRRSEEIDRNFARMDGYSKFAVTGATTVLGAGMAASPMGLLMTTAELTADWGTTLYTGDGDLGSKVGMGVSLGFGVPGIIKWGLGKWAGQQALRRSIAGELRALERTPIERSLSGRGDGPAAPVGSEPTVIVDVEALHGVVKANKPATLDPGTNVLSGEINVGGVKTAGSIDPGEKVLVDASAGWSEAVAKRFEARVAARKARDANRGVEHAQENLREIQWDVGQKISDLKAAGNKEGLNNYLDESKVILNQAEDQLGLALSEAKGVGQRIWIADPTGGLRPIRRNGNMFTFDVIARSSNVLDDMKLVTNMTGKNGAIMSGIHGNTSGGTVPEHAFFLHDKPLAESVGWKAHNFSKSNDGLPPVGGQNDPILRYWCYSSLYVSQKMQVKLPRWARNN